MRYLAHQALAVALSLCASATVQAASFTVNDAGDSTDAIPGDGTCADAVGRCTLRAAIQEANLLGGADTILLPAGTYTLTLPGRGEDDGATGDLDVIGDLTITGAGAATTIIDGGTVDRVFDSSAGLDLSGVTIRNGSSGAATEGGGIQNYGVLTLTDVTLAANTAGSGGGGLENALTATLERVTVSGNHAGFTGGGIKNDGTLTLTNVTLSGNQAGIAGGAIENADTVTLTSVTVGSNTGGGVDNMGVVTLENTLFAGSSPNCAGGVTSSGHNLDSANTCGLTGPGDLHDVDPLLGALQDNGGPTFTRALGAGSPAIDAGSGSCPPPATDQRGVARPMDGNGDSTAVCDIGAYEFEPSVTTTTIGTTTSTSATTSTTTSTSTVTTTSAPNTTSTVSTSTTTTSTTVTTSTSLAPQSTTSTTVASSTTSTSLPGTTTTTTTLPPGCESVPTLASIDCRLGALMDALQAGVPAGPVHDALTRQLGKAMTRSSQAAQAIGVGNGKRARKALAKAGKALAKFGGRLRTKKARKVVAAEVAAMLQTSADEVRADVLALRETL